MPAIEPSLPMASSTLRALVGGTRRHGAPQARLSERRDAHGQIRVSLAVIRSWKQAVAHHEAKLLLLGLRMLRMSVLLSRVRLLRSADVCRQALIRWAASARRERRRRPGGEWAGRRLQSSGGPTPSEASWIDEAASAVMTDVAAALAQPRRSSAPQSRGREGTPAAPPLLLPAGYERDGDELPECLEAAGRWSGTEAAAGSSDGDPRLSDSISEGSASGLCWDGPAMVAPSSRLPEYQYVLYGPPLDGLAAAIDCYASSCAAPSRDAPSRDAPSRDAPSRGVSSRDAASLHPLIPTTAPTTALPTAPRPPADAPPRLDLDAGNLRAVSSAAGSMAARLGLQPQVGTRTALLKVGLLRWRRHCWGCWRQHLLTARAAPTLASVRARAWRRWMARRRPLADAAYLLSFSCALGTCQQLRRATARWALRAVLWRARSHWRQTATREALRHWCLLTRSRRASNARHRTASRWYAQHAMRSAVGRLRRARRSRRVTSLSQIRQQIRSLASEWSAAREAEARGGRHR